jgi:serine/threonine protein kinase
VRKQLRYGDVESYENEVRVLSTLQSLNHPNIIPLVGCYTLNSEYNLMSPYMSGGSLQRLLDGELNLKFSRDELLYSIAGLASALWTLHEFGTDDTEPSYKGHHQDLRPANILVDDNRFILADFGLSSIKPLTELTQTPFKGRVGYCQAPECADLGLPLKEYETTRATDIFALACIILDLMTWYAKGTDGVKEFCERRKFEMSPMCYFLYHKGKSSNEAVATQLKKIVEESDSSQSVQDVVQLVTSMLEIAPEARPSAAVVTARLYLGTIEAFSETLSNLYGHFATSPDAQVEKARFMSWKLSQDLDLYSSSSGAKPTRMVFDETIDILRQKVTAFASIDANSYELDCRSFLEVRTLNTRLLSLLSEERRSSSRLRLNSMLLGSSISASSALSTALGDSRIAQSLETMRRIDQIEGDTPHSTYSAFHTVSGPLSYSQMTGSYKKAKMSPTQGKPRKVLIVESIQYQDPFRAQKLLPRVNALCDLLSNRSKGFRIPPFFGLHNNSENMCYELLYDFPTNFETELSQIRPTSLHEVLSDRERSHFPPLESRIKLALDLAEGLAAFHDVKWFHKDLTSFNVLFFPSQKARYAERAKVPYLFGFQHSRSAIDDFTEGPLQDRKHQRYHHPLYVCTENHQFKRFRPSFDVYSLGILLLEIGFWATVDEVMEAYRINDLSKFSDALQKDKVSELSFHVGSRYASIVRTCLRGLNHGPDQTSGKVSKATHFNLLLKQEVVIPLKDLLILHQPVHVAGSQRKRKIDEEHGTETRSIQRLRLQ